MSLQRLALMIVVCLPFSSATLTSQLNAQLASDRVTTQEQFKAASERLKLATDEFGFDSPEATLLSIDVVLGAARLKKFDAATQIRKEEECFALCLNKLDPGQHAEPVYALTTELTAAYRLRNQLTKAVTVNEQMVQWCETGRGAEDLITLEAKFTLAVTLYYAKEIKKAIVRGEQIISKLNSGKIDLATAPPRLLEIYSTMARWYQQAGESEKAVPLAEKAVELWLQREDEDGLLGKCRFLGRTCIQTKQPLRAIPLTRKALNFYRTTIGPNNPVTISVMADIASLHGDSGDYEAALRVRQEVVPLIKASVGQNHNSYLNWLKLLADTQTKAGKTDEAFATLEKRLSIMEKTRRPSHPLTLTAMEDLRQAYEEADLIAARDAVDARLKTARQALADVPRKLEQDLADATEAFKNDKQFHVHTSNGNSIYRLLNAYEASRKPEEAIKFGAEYLQELSASNGLSDPRCVNCVILQSTAMILLKKRQDAIDVSTAFVSRLEKEVGPDTLAAIFAQMAHAETLRLAQPESNAINLYKETLKQLEANPAATKEQILRSKLKLATWYILKQRFDQALPLLETLYPLMQKSLGPNDPDTIECGGSIGVCLFYLKRGKEAIPYLQSARDFHLSNSSNKGEHVRYLLAIATSKRDAGEVKEAKKLFEQIIVEADEIQDGERFSLPARSSLAAIFIKAEKFEEAEQIVRVMSVVSARYASGDPEIARVNQNLIKHYQEAGMSSRAHAWEQEMWATGVMTSSNTPKSD